MSVTEQGPRLTTSLQIGGMSCAACASRVEKQLNKLPGVSATVNFATETAQVHHDPSVGVRELVEVVKRTGYTATVPEPARPAGDEGTAHDHDSHQARLRARVIVNALLTLPVFVLAMVPAWQFTYWQWVMLALATPVVTWGAWPFHRAAALALWHRTATMDTLISLGVSVAYGWSLYALFLGMAGEPGMTMSFTLFAQRGDATGHIYLEVAAALTTFLTVGKWFEARA